MHSRSNPATRCLNSIRLGSAVFACLAIAAAGSRVLANDFHWSNPNGGLWTMPGNWDRNAVPGNADDVFIDLNTNYVIQLLGNRAVNSVTISAANATLWVDGMLGSAATLATTNGITNAGTIRLLCSGTITSSNLTVTNGALVNTGLIDVLDDPNHTIRNINGSVTNSGTISVQAGSTLNVNGTGKIFNQNAGMIACAGLLSFATGMPLNFNGGAMTNDWTNYVLNAGSLNIGAGSTGHMSIRMRGASTITGDLSSQQSVWIEGTLGFAGTLTSANGFTNAGTIRFLSGGGITSSNLTISTGTLINTGLIEAIDDSAHSPRNINGSVTNTGSITVQAGSTLTINGAGKMLNQNGGTIASDGLLSFASGTMFNFNGGATSNDWTHYLVSSGSLNIGSGATGQLGVRTRGSSTISGDIAPQQSVWIEGLLSSASTLTAANGFTNAGTIRLLSGGGFTSSNLVITSGSLTNTGLLEAVDDSAHSPRSVNGIVTNTGVITVQANITLTMLGSLANFSAGILTGGTFDLAGTLKFPNTGIVTNAADVTLDGTGSAIVNTNGGNAIATLATNSPAGVLSVINGRTFSHSGAFTNQGHLTVGSGSTLSATGGLANSGVLDGGGTVGNNLSNSGVVSPGGAPGAMMVTGTFAQSASGHLKIDFGGTAPGQSDLLNVSGTATLAGALDVSIISGFTPSFSDTYAFMNYGSESGQFDQIGGAMFCNGRRFDVTYGTGSASLIVLSDPGCAHDGDLDGDGNVDANDVPLFVAQLLGVAPPTLCADLNRDCHVDGDDIAPFIALAI